MIADSYSSLSHNSYSCQIRKHYPLHHLSISVSSLVILAPVSNHNVSTEKYDDVVLGGCECSVVFFDVDYKFNLLRLTSLLETRILAASASTLGVSAFMNLSKVYLPWRFINHE